MAYTLVEPTPLLSTVAFQPFSFPLSQAIMQGVVDIADHHLSNS